MAVIGGGAAGLAGAAAATRLGLSVVVLEKTGRCGAKLAITGGRKGNFTHADPPRKMADRFDCAPGLILPLLRRFPHQRITAFFRGLGIESRTDSEGCIWPARADAAGLRDALLDAIRKGGGEIRPGAAVRYLKPGWSIGLEGGAVVKAKNVLLATGGASYPRTGSTGDGIRLAAGLGLATTPWFVALASLRTRVDFSDLAGISQPRVGMALLAGPSLDRLELTRAAEGHFIFAHEHVSGSSVLKLCGFAARALATGGKAVLRVDWAPDETAHKLTAAIAEARVKQNRAKVTTVMAAWVSRRLAVRLCQIAGVPSDRYMAGLTRPEAEAVVKVLKATDLEITGTEPIERATVVGGGVKLDEIDLKTMESKRFPGLYFAGEVIDLWAETGGYNLHFAWASAIAAAEAIAGRDLN